MDHIVQCGNCGFLLQESLTTSDTERYPCPSCGSPIRKISKSVGDTIGIGFKEKLKAAGREAGNRKPFLEQTVGDDLFRKTQKWMKLSRVFDLRNDWYTEKVIDPDTGQVIHSCEEPLSEHRGHGSAKPRGPKRQEKGS